MNNYNLYSDLELRQLKKVMRRPSMNSATDNLHTGIRNECLSLHRMLFNEKKYCRIFLSAISEFIAPSGACPVITTGKKIVLSC